MYHHNGGKFPWSLIFAVFAVQHQSTNNYKGCAIHENYTRELYDDIIYLAPQKFPSIRYVHHMCMCRLSESNMKSISAQMEQLYRENSRNGKAYFERGQPLYKGQKAMSQACPLLKVLLYAMPFTIMPFTRICALCSDMNATLWSVLEKACVCPALISERFSMEQAMLVAVLHHRVGTEVGECPLPLPCHTFTLGSHGGGCGLGAHVVQSLVMRLDPLLRGGGGREGGKEADCLLLLLAHLYNYRVTLDSPPLNLDP